jgi:hypothetical protein
MNSTVELPHGGVRGAELEKQEQSSPKHAHRSVGEKKRREGAGKVMTH